MSVFLRLTRYLDCVRVEIERMEMWVGPMRIRGEVNGTVFSEGSLVGVGCGFVEWVVGEGVCPCPGFVRLHQV